MKIKLPSVEIQLTTLIRLLLLAALSLPAFVAKAQTSAVLTTLYSFPVYPNGSTPYASLVQGSDGYFYSTTSGGGMYSCGTVFKITANGALTTLYSFTGGNDGGNPVAGLVQGSDGFLYGTTESGGTNGNGTVFKITTNGALTSLYSFTGGNGGGPYPNGLVQGSDGYFYGITELGGTNVRGTVFKISTNGLLTTVYAFGTVTNAEGVPLDGAYPVAGLLQGTDGFFYGTCLEGGTNGGGTVFKISTNGALTSMYSFTGGNDGGNPYGGVVQGNDGYFYGTTSGGGTYGYGTVFKITTNGALTSLYFFTGTNDGRDPSAGLVQGSDGNFYGTTYGGGFNNYGTVFKINATGALTSLYSFTGGYDGFYPGASLVQGSDGNFYGTTSDGGTIGRGTVFKITTNGTLTTLYSFTGGYDGRDPDAGLVQGNDGNFYGTTGFGGTNGAGTVFQIDTNGALTTLYSFSGENYNSEDYLTNFDGANPGAALVQGSDGSFYGTTSGGGTNGYGTVFKIGTNGVLTTLYAFGTVTNANGDPMDGREPSGLVRGSDGFFYGTTGGGTNGDGTVFKINSNGPLTTLYAFGTQTNANGDALDGIGPTGLVQGGDGNFYGTTSGGGAYTNQYGEGDGTVFKISTNGDLTTLHAFGTQTNANGNALDGVGPTGLVQGSDGFFYGSTINGGIFVPTPGYTKRANQLTSFGTVFRISTNGTLTSLYAFTGGNDGGSPNGLVQGSDGNFYGTTIGYTFRDFDFDIVAYKSSTVFKISTHGVLTTLYTFGTVTNANGDPLDGAAPEAAPVQGSDGSFYGTTSAGGAGGSGTIFRLTIVPEFQTVTLTNGTLSLTWSTEAGGMYQLKYNSDLTSTHWTNLGTPIPATAATLTATDSLTNSPQRFYRLVLLP